jgi:hypothetical protein
MTKSHKSPHAAQENPLDEAVARALRDNLAPLQRTLEELQHAYADLAAACASSRAANALPAMLRAQSAAASLAGGLGVLSHFVTVALQPRDRSSAGAHAAAQLLEAAAKAGAEIEAAAEVAAEAELEEAAASSEETAAQVTEEVAVAPHEEPHRQELVEPPPSPASDNGAAVAETRSFEVESLATELQELHRRAKRVAKVAMQDIKMLRPKDVSLARENKDICARLRDDLDKARKEYDRRFKAILDHPVDYFHDSVVAILADGDPAALGEYPYPSPVLRH